MTTHDAEDTTDRAAGPAARNAAPNAAPDAPEGGGGNGGTGDGSCRLDESRDQGVVKGGVAQGNRT